jgi:hypothetical protein
MKKTEKTEKTTDDSEDLEKDLIPLLPPSFLLL